MLLKEIRAQQLLLKTTQVQRQILTLRKRPKAKKRSQTKVRKRLRTKRLKLKVKKLQTAVQKPILRKTKTQRNLLSNLRG